MNDEKRDKENTDLRWDKTTVDVVFFKESTEYANQINLFNVKAMVLKSLCGIYPAMALKNGNLISDL